MIKELNHTTNTLQRQWQTHLCNHQPSHARQNFCPDFQLGERKNNAKLPRVVPRENVNGHVLLPTMTAMPHSRFYNFLYKLTQFRNLNGKTVWSHTKRYFIPLIDCTPPFSPFSPRGNSECAMSWNILKMCIHWPYNAPESWRKYVH